MSLILLDTNIISFLLKGDSRADLYVPHLQNQQLALSFMTLAELYQWTAVRQWSDHRISQLEQILRESYIILDFNIALCQLWGNIRAKRRAIGKPISPEDAWIAATALHYSIPLVTHNPIDFEDVNNLKIVTADT
jgi:tRNA(fMet)-specific endonuclease VapC